MTGTTGLAVKSASRVIVRCRDCTAPTARRWAVWCDTCRWRHRGKPARYHWTTAKDDAVRDLYRLSPSARAARRARLAHLWGWPIFAITKRARQLGLARVKERPWTTEQIAFLGVHVGNRHVEWIARHLPPPHRTLTALVVKLKRLGIARRLSAWTAREVAQGFGVDDHVVLRWIDQGWLKATPNGDHAGRGCCRWLITDEIIRQFVRSYPTAFELWRCDQLWFLSTVLKLGTLLVPALERVDLSLTPEA